MMEVQLTEDILDVGCGPHCLPGAVGIDQFENPGVRFVHDLCQAPWPLPENHFRKIRCQHVIEHIRELQVMVREMYRVSSDGTEIHFITPHYSSYASWGDPTHVWHCALASIPLLFTQVLGQGKFEVIENRLQFTGSVGDLFGWLIYRMSPRKYEKKWAWIFPCNEIHTKIRIRKANQT
jgi:hypothetical protein